MDTKPKELALLAAQGVAASGIATLLACSLPLPLLSSSNALASSLGIALLVLPLVLGAAWVVVWPFLTGRPSVPASIFFVAPFVVTTEVSRYWAPLYEIDLDSSRLSYLWGICLILIAYFVDRKVRKPEIQPFELPLLLKGIGWALLSYGIAVSVNSAVNGFTMTDPIPSSSLTSLVLKSDLSQSIKDTIILGIFSQKELIFGVLGFLAISIVRKLPFLVPALGLVCIQALFLATSGYDWVGISILVGITLAALSAVIAQALRRVPVASQT